MIKSDNMDALTELSAHALRLSTKILEARDAAGHKEAGEFSRHSRSAISVARFITAELKDIRVDTMCDLDEDP